MFTSTDNLKLEVLNLLVKKLKVGTTFFLLVITLSTIFIALFSLEVKAAVTIISINPTEGYVGTTVIVNGTLFNMSSRHYKIFFDGEEVANGITPLGDVFAGFTVPDTVAGVYEVTLYDDDFNQSSEPEFFEVLTDYNVEAVMTPPKQTQEGQNTTIRVEVVGGMENEVYTANITVENPQNITSWVLTQVTTNTVGFGETLLTYPTDFGPGANTNYVGLYEMAFNGTDLDTYGSFKVGLTNSTLYHRFQVVNVRAVGYQSLEMVNVTITHGGEVIFHNTAQASGLGVISLDWEILGDAPLGVYIVTVENLTSPGTVKTPADQQSFNVTTVSYQVSIQTLNLNSEPVGDATIEVYNQTSSTPVDFGTTDELGMASFLLDAGRYNISVLWKNSEVGTVDGFEVFEDTNTTITCNLARVVASIYSENREPLPFVNVTMAYSYMQRDGTPVNATNWLESNQSGNVVFNNLFLNVNYTFESRRYQNIFNVTTIENLVQAELLIEIICPAYTVRINVTDSQGNPLSDVNVTAYEWQRGLGVPEDQGITDDTGNVTLHVTFSKYRLRISQLIQGNSVLLNETIADVFQNPTITMIECRLYNISLQVKAVDFFSQPIPQFNVTVKVGVEVEFGKRLWLTYNALAGSDGIAELENVFGGNCTVLVQVGSEETPSGTTSLNLDAPRLVVVKIGKYVMVGGWMLKTSDLATLTVSTVILLLGLFTLFYKRLSQKFAGGRKEKV